MGSWSGRPVVRSGLRGCRVVPVAVIILTSSLPWVIAKRLSAWGLSGKYYSRGFCYVAVFRYVAATGIPLHERLGYFTGGSPLASETGGQQPGATGRTTRRRRCPRRAHRRHTPQEV